VSCKQRKLLRGIVTIKKICKREIGTVSVNWYSVYFAIQNKNQYFLILINRSNGGINCESRNNGRNVNNANCNGRK
jgi:hypothetical protein